MLKLGFDVEPKRKPRRRVSGNAGALPHSPRAEEKIQQDLDALGSPMKTTCFPMSTRVDTPALRILLNAGAMKNHVLGEVVGAMDQPIAPDSFLL